MNIGRRLFGIDPKPEEEFTVLEQKFVDVANWIIKECCFGGVLKHLCY